MVSPQGSLSADDRLQVPAVRARTPRPFSIGLLALAFCLAGNVSGVSPGSAEAKKAKPAASKKRPKGKGEQAPVGALPPAGPVAPVTVQAMPVVLPAAALRIECSVEGSGGRFCELVQEAVRASVSRRYQVIPAAKVDGLFTKEPSLRGCRRDECRAVIAEQLGVSHLVDVILQAPRSRGVLANIAVFDPEAKGISAEAEVLLKPDEEKLRRSIEEAVDQVLATQRLTAPLRIECKPAGAKVTIVDGRGTARELTEAERAGGSPVRVFLGQYSVRAEKARFVTDTQAVTVAQVGASVSIELKPQPATVRFDWHPEGTKVLVDGELLSSRDQEVELTEGSHRVEAIAPPGQLYQSTVFTINAQIGMDPVRISLQRLTEVRVAAPLGYTVSIDGQRVNAEQIQVRGREQIASVPTAPGAHTVLATSWNGLQISRAVEAEPRASTDLRITPPSLLPGAVIGGIGLAALLGGATTLIVGYSKDICTRPDCESFFRPDLPGGLLVGIGGVAFIAGASWFGWAAQHHPAFYRAKRSSLALSPSVFRPHWVPVVTPTLVGVQTTLRF
jgi:hypothetical protein